MKSCFVWQKETICSLLQSAAQLTYQLYRLLLQYFKVGLIRTAVHIMLLPGIEHLLDEAHNLF